MNLNHRIILPKFSADFLAFFDGQLTRVNPYLLFYFYLKGDDSKHRKEVLEQFFCPMADLSMLSPYRARHRDMIMQYARRGYEISCWQMQLSGRLLVGKGIASDFDNGILLHWIHGFSYITGRTLKGAARAWASGNRADDDENYFSQVFGAGGEEEPADTSSRGKVIFFDALPVQDHHLFDLDVTTCHYKYYYDENPSLPGDWMDPNPIVTLTVKMDVVFEFALASKNGELVDKAESWLKEALIKSGVGAEKHSGLGHFYGA